MLGAVTEHIAPMIAKAVPRLDERSTDQRDWRGLVPHCVPERQTASPTDDSRREPSELSVR